MVEPLEPQQTADHNTRCQFSAAPTKQRHQLHATALAPAAASAPIPTKTSTRTRFSAANTRHRPPPLTLHNYQLRNAICPSYTSTPYLKTANPGCEHDYYQQNRHLTPESTEASSPLIANVHKLSTDCLFFTTDSVNPNDPALLSTAASKQQQQPHIVPQVEPASQLQPYPRPSSTVHHYPPQHISPAPPQQNPSPYRSPNITTHPQHYSQQASTSRQGQELYQTGQQIPYATPAPSQYSSNSTPELMAAAQMQRPSYSQSIYHTPQSTSPTSIASQHSHDYSRMYTSQTGQLNQPLQYGTYTPTMNQLPTFGHHPSQSHAPNHGTAGSPLLLSHQQNVGPLTHQSSNTSVMDASPARTELEMSLQRPLDITRSQSRPHVDSMPSNPPMGGGPRPTPTSGGSGSGNNSAGAAPGPIPATTPLVVRQDQNGVQWIAFEYSRERIKMEYTIRCDVESIDTEALDADFKAENCVYPRACVPKSEYKGNRFHYENECNNVGWALAELNSSLRQKRGLIQRAVDSWRNSNANPKLRSRRVRRMAKNDKRQRDQLSNSHGHGHGHGALMGPGLSRAPSMSLPMPRGPLSMGVPQLHHHHTTHSEGSINSGPENVSETSPSEDIRPNHVFHQEYPTYLPQQSVYATSTMPSIHDGLNTLGSTTFHSASPLVTPTKLDKHVFEEPVEKLRELYGNIPPNKYRKFILMKDDERKDAKDSKDGRSRIRVQLGRVNLEDIPDSYRKANSVYPRVYYSRQFVDDNAITDPRIVSEHENDGNTSEACISKVLVPIPLLDGEPLALPRVSKSKRRREDLLNEIGYRMLWSNGSTFSGRPLFMQKCLDLYRCKTREAILNENVQYAGNCDTMDREVAIIPPQFRTRIGKQKWLNRRRKGNSRDDDDDDEE